VTARRRPTVAVIGTGLIGASIGLALRKRRGSAPPVTGWDPRSSNLTKALAAGALTRRAPTLVRALRGASRIVLAAPLDAILGMLPEVIGSADRGATIFECGPVKRPVASAARRLLRKRPDLLFVSCHPMAGRESSGPQAAARDLFSGRPFVLVTPVKRRRVEALAAGVRLARALGAVPTQLTAQAHDRLVAAVSALPQLASIALALAARRCAGSLAVSIAGPGFRDATRLAESPFDIWRPALSANASNVKAAMRALGRAVAAASKAVECGDAAALARMFSGAAAARRRILSS
jgi:prephenate dehydrogenase